MINRRLALGFVAGALTLLSTAAIAAESKVHKLALQISDNVPEKMNAVLDVAANVSRFYSDKGEEVSKVDELSPTRPMGLDWWVERRD